MAQGVKCLSCGLKGLTSNPRTHVKRQVWLIPALGLHQQAERPLLVESVPCARNSNREERRPLQACLGTKGRTPKVNLWLNTHLHALTRTLHT